MYVIQIQDENGVWELEHESDLTLIYHDLVMALLDAKDHENSRVVSIIPSYYPMALRESGSMRIYQIDGIEGHYRELGEYEPDREDTINFNNKRLNKI